MDRKTLVINKHQRPLCDIHPDQRLVALSEGWVCEKCNRSVMDFQSWPGPNEPLSSTYVTQHLPTFLAAKISNIDKETHPVVRLWMLCDLTEVLLRLCVILGAAEIEISKGRLPDDVAKNFLENNRILRPTLDGWLHLAQVVAKGLEADTLFPEIRVAVEEVSGSFGPYASRGYCEAAKRSRPWGRW